MRYAPIEDHGVIGDLHTVALVATDGNIDWYCPGRFDAPSVFAAILDADRGGRFQIAPEDEPGNVKQLYLPETNVLITRFLTPHGVGEVQDFMPIREGATADVPQRIVRRVVCVRGSMRFRLDCEPRFDYGRATHTLAITPGGAAFATPQLALTLASGESLLADGADVHAVFTLSSGEMRTFVLEVAPVGATAPRVCDDDEAQVLFDETVAFWRKWIAGCTYRGRWRETVRRSALCLKLLTYAPSGAIVAAPTASLPEGIGGVRNWDYRYTWIRDSAFTLYAFLRLGFTREAEAFMNFLRDRAGEMPADSDLPRGAPLQIMYAIDGSHDLEEFELDHLDGYRHSRPVRIGNGAAKQLQLDIYGELIDSIYLYNKFAAPISYDLWQVIVRLLGWLKDHWRGADEGIWEVRGGQQEFTYSRLMSWVAFERAIRMARQRGLPCPMVEWLAVRDEIFEEIMTRGWNEEKQAFVQTLDGDALDASNLLMPLVRFVAPADPRMLSTLDAIGRELVSDSLVYRYVVEEAASDGLDGEEGTFSICSFWWVEALARAGRVDEARLAFEKMLTYANHLGLYSEEIGTSGEALGNFPQAFTHLSLVSAAMYLDRALDSPRPH
jgi:GH15 family glucan-1,4-alpha-glucosidase